MKYHKKNSKRIQKRKQGLELVVSLSGPYELPHRTRAGPAAHATEWAWGKLHSTTAPPGRLLFAVSHAPRGRTRTVEEMVPTGRHGTMQGQHSTPGAVLSSYGAVSSSAESTSPGGRMSARFDAEGAGMPCRAQRPAACRDVNESKYISLNVFYKYT